MKHSVRIKTIFQNVIDFVVKYKKYFLAGLVFAIIVLVLGRCTNGTASDHNPMAGAYQQYKVADNEELNKLFETYYKAYAAGDVASLEKIATPISEAEKSYIQFISQYIEKYDNLTIYCKRGLDNDSYLISAAYDMKFKDIETLASGLEFFYVKTDKNGKLIIDNTYASFNRNNGEFDTDPEIVTLIATFEQQEDVKALQAEIQQKYNEALMTDEVLNNFINGSLQEAKKKWIVDYQATVATAEAAAKAEAEAKAKAEAEAKAKAEAEEAARQQAALEEANAVMVVTLDRVNVRSQASEDGDKLGTIEEGTTLKRYGEENGWSKIDYNGTKAYVKSEYVQVQENASQQEQQVTNEPTQEQTTTVEGGYDPGQSITLSNTLNVRSSMSEEASKVGVVYEGDTVTVQMSYAEGWTKITYNNNKEGYVKTEFLK